MLARSVATPLAAYSKSSAWTNVSLSSFSFIDFAFGVSHGYFLPCFFPEVL